MFGTLKAGEVCVPCKSSYKCQFLTSTRGGRNMLVRGRVRGCEEGEVCLLQITRAKNTSSIIESVFYAINQILHYGKGRRKIYLAH